MNRFAAALLMLLASASAFAQLDEDRFSPRLYPPATQSLHTSKPVDVWIVERIGQKTAYVSDPQFDRKRLDALRARFNPALAWSDARFRLYRAPRRYGFRTTTGSCRDVSRACRVGWLSTSQPRDAK